MGKLVKAGLRVTLVKGEEARIGKGRADMPPGGRRAHHVDGRRVH